MKRIHANISEETQEVRGRHRGRIDLLRSRLNLLSGKDKVLMTMYVENGTSFRQIARLLGVSETSISRKVHRITRRLIDGEYITCLRNRDRLTRGQMAIAKDYYLMGLSMSKIAGKRQLSIYRVRQDVMKIKSLIQNSE
ncbi:MAG: sigma factor-like helix-turn-helix DNA-binding protein [Phycisphaerae bacterium]